MKREIIENAIHLRKMLHAIPETAFSEKKTKKMLIDSLKRLDGIEIHDCGEWFYAVYMGSSEAPMIAFRADMDAVAGEDGLPGHFCGHDGHAAVLAAFAEYLSEWRPERSVCMIFQPAEEIGKGALLCREVLKKYEISEIYGFHNIPGYPVDTVVLCPGTFACASTGMEITVVGSPSHAAYPEDGKNPADVIAELIMECESLKKGGRQKSGRVGKKETEDCEPEAENVRNGEQKNKRYEGLTLVTVIGAEIGSDAYGVSASKGVLRLTVRGEYGHEFRELVHTVSAKAEKLSAVQGMNCYVRLIDEFPATENTAANVMRVENAAERAGLAVLYRSEPFRWSEDFGYYLQELPGAYFGVGAGEKHSQLHTRNYEFPDEIMEGVLKLYEQLVVR